MHKNLLQLMSLRNDENEEVTICTIDDNSMISDIVRLCTMLK